MWFLQSGNNKDVMTSARSTRPESISVLLMHMLLSCPVPWAQELETGSLFTLEAQGPGDFPLKFPDLLEAAPNKKCEFDGNIHT